MKKLLAMTVATVAMSFSAPNAIDANAQSVEPYPVEYWAVRDQMSNVSLSPDGKKLAFMKIASRDGNPVIEVRDVDNLMGKPYTIGGKTMEITSFDWVGDEDLIITFRDQVSKFIGGFNQGAYKNKTAHFDMRNKKFNDLTEESSRSIKLVQFINALPEDPNKVLVRIFEIERGRANTGLGNDYFKLDLTNGKREFVMSGDSKYDSVRFDHKGNPRFAESFSADKTTFHYKLEGEENWREYYSLPRSSFETFSYAGSVEGSPDQIYVIANNGHDRTGLWSFNLRTNQFEDLVYRDSTVDIVNTFRHSNSWSNPGKVTGYSYFKDRAYRKYFDATEETIMKRFEASISNAGLVTISSRSRDGDTVVVENVGPKDPGTFYLYQANSGKFIKIGSANGLLKPEGLSDVEYITYKARDGKTIPAFVTKPKGAGPHPLVVMPHGGPFIREFVLFDEWAQMLANNGYMVMQPQYRGSQGYGIDFYKTSFENGGEGGRKMQDDKDDGVKYLISKGMVDADKVAFFGWSYGGYAALIAAARTPNLYNCSIAGAAVADNFQQVNYYRARLSADTASGQEQLNMWTDSVNPIDEVENVNIPLLVIHGSIDQRVPPKHSAKYVDALKKENKDYEYIKLKDADHFSNTLFYDHKMEFYPAMLEFLDEKCGM